MLYPVPPSGRRFSNRESRRTKARLAKAIQGGGPPMGLEALEDRRLLSAVLSGGILTITGTNAPDTISLTMGGGANTLDVTVNAASH